MLFEGAIRFLERSLPGFTNTDPAESNMIIHNNLQRAQQIIRELNAALNMEQGGEFAENMRRLYNYFERRIWESNVRKNPAGVGEVIRHLNVLRDAWATMLTKHGSPEPATLAA